MPHSLWLRRRRWWEEGRRRRRAERPTGTLSATATFPVLDAAVDAQ
ncbi:hypothetical protein EVG20_g8902, partial [Dentipellis fragilis]